MSTFLRAMSRASRCRCSSAAPGFGCRYAFGPTIGAAVNVTLLTYVDTCALGIDVDTGAIPDYDVCYDCLVAGFDEVLAVAG